MDPLAKKPKLEPADENKERILALVQHRRQEVQQLTRRFEATKVQLEEAKKKLCEAEAQLAKLQNLEELNDIKLMNNNGDNPPTKREHTSTSSSPAHWSSSKVAPQSKPPLVIPSAVPKTGISMRVAEGSKASSMSSGRPSSASSPHSRSEADSKPKLSLGKPSNQSQSGDSQERRPKRKFEQKEHIELISSIRKSSTPKTKRFQTGSLLSSMHKRKLRSLIMNPVSEGLFATSALDGVVNLWQLQSRGVNASLLSTNDCLSPGQRRWPEDMTWHPFGDSIFSCYSADGGDYQVAITNLNVTKNRVTFLEHKPHVKGIVNNISFMPWENLCFATGGSDHAVVMWNEEENSWKPKALHRNLHSSAVMGVAGLQQKPVVLSVGADKRIIGYDIKISRADFKHQLDSKAMGVLPNPSDFNLFMVQTGTPEKQLRLFDIRAKQSEIHAFGWKQESSESQSALINQTWSPDGFYIASGSVDPMFHIFDIRYNSRQPAQSVKAHSKRVFKAAWHCSWPLIVSISSDLHIGLHRIL